MRAVALADGAPRRRTQPMNDLQKAFAEAREAIAAIRATPQCRAAWL